MESINFKNIAPLDIIQNKILKKRLSNEILILNEDNISLFFYLEEKNKTPVIQIIDEKYKNMNIYKIFFYDNYPFSSPKIYINEEPYGKILSDKFLNLNKFISEKMRKFYSKNCLCCSSITCSNNWSPSFSINNLIKEIRQNRINRNEIIYVILINVIKKKYLIEDINLYKWLIIP
jgi:ubiquitin-protein ligase